jgi:hypothetical protein
LVAKSGFGGDRRDRFVRRRKLLCSPQYPVSPNELSDRASFSRTKHLRQVARVHTGLGGEIAERERLVELFPQSIRHPL